MSSTERPTRRGIFIIFGTILNAPPRSPSVFPSCAFSSPRRSASGGPDTTPGSRSVRCPLPDRRDAFATFRNPVVAPSDGETAKVSCWVRNGRRRAVPDLRDQLRAPRLPRALVPPVQPLHVPLPRRRVLCRRFPRVRASGARALEYRYKIEGDNALHRGRADAHAGSPLATLRVRRSTCA